MMMFERAYISRITQAKILGAVLLVTTALNAFTESAPPQSRDRYLTETTTPGSDFYHPELKKETSLPVALDPIYSPINYNPMVGMFMSIAAIHAFNKYRIRKSTLNKENIEVKSIPEEPIKFTELPDYTSGQFSIHEETISALPDRRYNPDNFRRTHDKRRIQSLIRPISIN